MGGDVLKCREDNSGADMACYIQQAGTSKCSHPRLCEYYPKETGVCRLYDTICVPIAALKEMEVKLESLKVCGQYRMYRPMFRMNWLPCEPAACSIRKHCDVIADNTARIS